MGKQEKNVDEYVQREDRAVELRVLVLFSIYSAALFGAACLLGWDYWVGLVFAAFGAISWGMYLKQYKSYRYRASAVTAFAVLDLLVYGIYAEHFVAVIPTIGALAVMFAMYGLAENIYSIMLCSAVLILYHGIVTGDVGWKPTMLENYRQLMEFISIFIIEYLAWYLVRKQSDDKRTFFSIIRRMRQAEQSQNDFLANMSHELRTPINTVTGMSEILLQKDLPEAVRQEIFDIQIAGRSLLSIVTDILDYIELEEGNVELVEEPYNIISTINDVINMALAQNQEKKLDLIVDCDATVPSVLVGDEQKIRRVMANLVGNAIKFTSKGCVTITISFRKEGYGVNLNISVRDTGIGMEQKEIDRLFQGFYQVDAKRSRRKEGIGLGLTICNGLVQRMGGFLNVRSEMDKGSEFMFSIPQKVMDESPAISVAWPEKLNVLCYFDWEENGFADTRDDYMHTIHRLSKTLGVNMELCRNQSNLEKKISENKFTHLFIGAGEYNSDPAFYERLGREREMDVTVIIDRTDEIPMNSNVSCIYKPFYALTIANVLNGKVERDSYGAIKNQYQPFVAPDIKALIVDDNIMNLKVAEGLLLQYKIRIATAVSGWEAIKKLETMDYDLVFMDHMMPGMDGVEALRRIRKKMGRYYQTVPVIALTANAIGGAREMFLQEGFQDFIAKPIDLSVLERVLRRFIPEKKMMSLEEWKELHPDSADGFPGKRAAAPQGNREAGEAGAAAPHGNREAGEAGAAAPQGDCEAGEAGAAAPQGDREAGEAGAAAPQGDCEAGEAEQPEGGRPDAGADEEILAAEKALAEEGIHVPDALAYFDGDREAYAEIAMFYCMAGDENIPKIEESFEKENWQDYVVYVHAVKSTSLTIGANQLSEMAKELEFAGKKGDAGYIQSEHRAMMAEYGRVIDALRKSPLVTGGDT